MIFARKMPEFYIIIARKIFFPIFFLFWGQGGGTCPPAPPLLYAYGAEDVIHCWYQPEEPTSVAAAAAATGGDKVGTLSSASAMLTLTTRPTT